MQSHDDAVEAGGPFGHESTRQRPVRTPRIPPIDVEGHPLAAAGPSRGPRRVGCGDRERGATGEHFVLPGKEVVHDLSGVLEGHYPGIQAQEEALQHGLAELVRSRPDRSEMEAAYHRAAGLP